MTYLDWAATTPPDPEIIEIMAKTSGEYFGNPSSSHLEGQRAREFLENARLRCANVLECAPEQLAFTSGGTESNAIALLSHLNARSPGTILVSSLEHPSVNDPLRVLSSCGWTLKTLQSDSVGIVDPGQLETALKNTPDARSVVIMAVSNELGVIQPIEDMAAVIRSAEKNGHRPVHFHSDMVQAAGKIPIDLSASGVDTASFSAHKFRGPRAVGLFYHRRSQFEALLRGGGQENNVRPGTQNVAGAQALALALELHGRPSPSVRENGEWLLKRLLSTPEARIIPAKRTPESSHFVPGIIAVSFPPLPGEVVARMLGESGYAVSTGSACRSNSKSRLSNSLAALNISEDIAKCMIRISLGSSTTRKELEDFIAALQNCIEIRNKHC